MSFFTYKILIFDYSTSKNIQICGITFGETFTEAMKHIEDYYENDLIEIISLYGFEVGMNVLETEEDIINKIRSKE